MRQQTAHLIALPPERWKAITVRMSWYFRTNGAALVPTEVLYATDAQLPTEDEWTALRKAVTKVRRTRSARVIRRAAAQKVKHRRDYMAKYMRGYRIRKAHG